MLLPPLTLLFPPPSPLPLSPLSGCVRRTGRSGGTATPVVIRDRLDGRTTKTRYGTASAAALAAAAAAATEEAAAAAAATEEAAAATEEGGCDRCDGANPRRHLDDSLLRLADGILLPPPLDRRENGAAARLRWSPATATTLMPAIDIGALFIGREDREGSDGSGIAKEDDDDTDVEAGGRRAISWRSSSADGKGVLGGGERQ